MSYEYSPPPPPPIKIWSLTWRISIHVILNRNSHFTTFCSLNFIRHNHDCTALVTYLTAFFYREYKFNLSHFENIFTIPLINIRKHCIILRETGYYTAVRRYEFYLRMVKTIFYEGAQRMSKNIVFTTRRQNLYLQKSASKSFSSTV